MRKKYIGDEANLTKSYKLAFYMMIFTNIFTLVSFLSPYWIKTKFLIDHEFSNMGLWEICFNDFNNIQMIRKGYLDGCKQILSAELFELRYWFLPNWLRWVQLLSIFNLTLTFSTLFFIMISIFTRLKENFFFIIFISTLIMILGKYKISLFTTAIPPMW